MYLTYPENMISSIIINFQTEQSLFDAADSQPKVYYDTISHAEITDDTDFSREYKFSLDANTYIYQSDDISRGIHWSQLDNLLPDTSNAK